MKKLNSTTILFHCLKYFLFFILFYILQIAEIGNVKPFAFGMLFALVWCNQKIWLLAPLFICSSILADFTILNLISSSFCALFFCLVYFLHYKFKKPFKPILMTFYAFLSQFAFLYVNSFTAENFATACISVVVGLIVMYAYICFLQGVLLRGIKRQWTLDELISAGIFIVAIGVGIGCLPNPYDIVRVAFTSFLIITAVWVLNQSSSIIFSTLLGLGVCLSNGNVEFLALTIIWSLVANMMKSSKKIFSCCAIILSDIFINLYFFYQYNIYNLIAIFAGVLLFLLIPDKTLIKLQTIFNFESNSFSIKNVISKNRELLSNRILQTSEIFIEMQTVFQSMIKKQVSDNEASLVLAKELINKVCEKCSNKENCLRLNYEKTLNNIEYLMKIALERGRATVIDVPKTMVGNCSRINVVIPYANNLSKQYKSQKKIQTNLDNSKMLLGEQLFGIAQILKSLSYEVNLNITFNHDKEEKIIENLIYQNIVCIEVLVYYQNLSSCNVSLLVKSSNAKDEKIALIVSKIIGTKMEVSNVYYSDKAGFSVVNLKSAIMFDVAFGCAGVTKNGSEKSGDTHSVLRINDNQFLIALCDGMGSGEQAEKTSALALCLIENFYKAGFESSLILSSVNKLLTLKGDENFNALDVCVFDLNKGFCDIIKVGSPSGFIKSDEKTEIINSGCLPLGILDEIKPEVQSKILKNGDMVILVTDGIIDAVEDENALCNFINNINATNPQVMAELIVEYAMQQQGNLANDDMTVLVGRLWEKV